MTKTTEEGLDLIRKVLDWDVRYRSGPEANERLMIAACAGSVDLDVVCATFDKIRPQLVYSELWEESVRGLKLAHPEWQINQADLNILAAEWSRPGLLDFDVSADGLIKLAETLNKKQTFAFTDAYTAQQAEINLRARLIEEISLGRTDFYE